MFGLKVRGQRTRCTGRKGGAVGVAKGGKIMPAREGEAVEGAPTAGAEETEPAVEAKEGSEKKEAPTAGKKEAPAAGKKEAPAADKKK
jgi:small subunit ribosomal protein S13